MRLQYFDMQALIDGNVRAFATQMTRLLLYGGQSSCHVTMIIILTIMAWKLKNKNCVIVSAPTVDKTWDRKVWVQSCCELMLLKH